MCWAALCAWLSLCLAQQGAVAFIQHCSPAKLRCDPDEYLAHMLAAGGLSEEELAQLGGGNTAAQHAGGGPQQQPPQLQAKAGTPEAEAARGSRQQFGGSVPSGLLPSSLLSQHALPLRDLMASEAAGSLAARYPFLYARPEELRLGDVAALLGGYKELVLQYESLAALVVGQQQLPAPLPCSPSLLQSPGHNQDASDSVFDGAMLDTVSAPADTAATTAAGMRAAPTTPTRIGLLSSSGASGGGAPAVSSTPLAAPSAGGSSLGGLELIAGDAAKHGSTAAAGSNLAAEMVGVSAAGGEAVEAAQASSVVSSMSHGRTVIPNGYSQRYSQPAGASAPGKEPGIAPTRDLIDLL